KVAEDDIWRKAADVRHEYASCHPSVERAGNQGERRIVVVAHLHIWRAIRRVEIVIAAAPGLEPRRISRIGKEDPNIGIVGKNTESLIGGPALPGLCRAWEIPGYNRNLEHCYITSPTT